MSLVNYHTVDRIMQMYEEKGFNQSQIKEIRRGIEENIDISQFDDINMPADKMFNIRWQLIHKKMKEGGYNSGW